MRVAYITTHFPFGHDETFFEPEVRSLSLFVDRVYVLPARPRSPQSAFGDLGSVDVYVPANGRCTLALALAEIRRDPWAVACALWSIVGPRYRIVAKGKNLALFPKALATANVLRRIGVDHVHAQWLTTSATTAMIAARLIEVPWSVTAHQHDIFFGNMIRQKCADATFVRVISERNAHFLRGLAGDVPDNVHVLHLGVDVPRTFTQRRAAGPVTMLCAARFESSKGHRYLIEALALLKARGIAFRCDLAGRGVLQDDIEQRIAAAGLSGDVVLRGVVQHRDLVSELAGGAYDLAVLASTERPGEHEGIPVAMMEAMAAAVPCVTTATGSNAELIDAMCGVLVPQRDPRALADALTSLATAPERRRKLGLNARARIVEAFETRRTTAELFALIAATDDQQTVTARRKSRLARS